MSREQVDDIISRALADGNFRGEILDRPYDALAAYELSPEEQGALVAGSEQGLIELGIDGEKAADFAAMFAVSEGGGG